MRCLGSDAAKFAGLWEVHVTVISLETSRFDASQLKFRVQVEVAQSLRLLENQ